jgi:polyisoprenoid-binding protein YceI
MDELEPKRVWEHLMRSLLTALIVTVVSAVCPMAAGAQDLMIMDERRHFIGFEVELLGLFKVDGRFNKASGAMRYDASDPAASKVKITVNTASIDTDIEIRDNELRSSAFFDVSNHPTMVFESTETILTAGSVGIVRGNLTLKGITRPITLQVRASGGKRAANKKAMGASFEASGKVRREDYGLGLGDARLTLRADFIKCVGKPAAKPACKTSL